MSLEKLDQLLNEMGEILNPHSIRGQGTDLRWVMELDSDSVLLFEVSEARQIMTISATIGLMSDFRREQNFQRMLSYNSMIDETGGVRLALEELGEEAVLMIDVAMSVLEPRALATICRNLADLAITWRPILQSVNAGALEDPAFTPGETMIRI